MARVERHQTVYDDDEQVNHTFVAVDNALRGIGSAALRARRALAAGDPTTADHIMTEMQRQLGATRTQLRKDQGKTSTMRDYVRQAFSGKGHYQHPKGYGKRPEGSPTGGLEGMLDKGRRADELRQQWPCPSYDEVGQILGLGRKTASKYHRAYRHWVAGHVIEGERLRAQPSIHLGDETSYGLGEQRPPEQTEEGTTNDDEDEGRHLPS